MAGIFRIPDAMWERIEPLIPPPEKVHPFGGGRSRVPDRVVLDAIFFVLRTGCQWRALNATGICSSSTAHRRFQECQQAGFFQALWEQALRDYDEAVGIALTVAAVEIRLGQHLDRAAWLMAFGLIALVLARQGLMVLELLAPSRDAQAGLMQRLTHAALGGAGGGDGPGSGYEPL